MPDADELLNALDPEQREAARTLRGPVVVMAGAGTGKTRAITHRIAYGVATGVYKPTEVLAVTFTTRAAGELRQRLSSLGASGVQARTFHSAALRQDRYFWPQVYGGQMPEIIKSKVPLLRETAKRLGLSAPQDLVRDIASEIEWAKVSNVRPADYVQIAQKEHREVAELSAADVSEIYATYESVKTEAGRMDMEDILLANAAMLSENERVAAQVRQQYRWFVVDEFQDVNPLQVALLDLWLGGREDVCVVGDPRQTIYSFAGASQDYLTRFARSYPRATWVELVRNYRSTPQIVAAANATFRDSREAGVQLESQSDPGEPVGYKGHSDENTEAAEIAAQIQLLHRAGVAYRDMAVLYRINAQSEAYQESLSARQIPYCVRDDVPFFDRPEVRQAVTLMRGSARAAQSDQGVRDEVRSLLASIGYTDEPPHGKGSVRDRWESLHTLMTMAAELPDRSTLTDLVAELDRRAGIAHAPTMDGVTLSTLHSAKGLEWDAVFCVGMHEGTMPLIYATTENELREEKRLFYVGITRARQKLAISWAEARSPEHKSKRLPTRYLDNLLPSDHQARKTKGPKQQRKAPRCHVCQRPLSSSDRKHGHCADCVPDYDPQVFQALRQWRSDLAQKQSVPAFVILTDATLRVVAEIQPQTLETLASVHGIGRTKLDLYGAQILDVVKNQAASQS